MAAVEPGSAVWVRDPDEVWVAATVEEGNDAGARVRLEGAGGGERSVGGDDLLVREDAGDAGAVDDLTELTHLHEAAILDSLVSPAHAPPPSRSPGTYPRLERRV